MAASLVNRLVAELVELGYVEVMDGNVRPFAYRLTDRGRDYQHRLDYDHLRSVVGTFREVQERIRKRLRDIKGTGVSRLVFYGTGDVMEVAYPLAEVEGFQIVGLVDDDPEKQGSRKHGHVVNPPSAIQDLQPEGVLITTFRHTEQIRDRAEGAVQKEISLVEL